MEFLGEADSEVILYLMKIDKDIFTNIRDEVSLGQYALNTSLTKLKSLGITVETRGDRNARFISLTSNGKEIAVKLQEIQNILKRN